MVNKIKSSKILQLILWIAIFYVLIMILVIYGLAKDTGGVQPYIYSSFWALRTRSGDLVHFLCLNRLSGPSKSKRL